MQDQSKLIEQQKQKNRIELYAEYGIGSFWGAVASFFWLQLFAFAIFHIGIVFVQGMDVNRPGTIINLLFVLFFSYEFIRSQSMVFSSLKGYFSRHGGTYAPRGIKDFLKAVFALILLSALVLLFLGYLPISDATLLQTIPLYVVSWIASYYKKPKPYYPMTSLRNTLAFLLSGIFLLLLSVFYFGGLGLFTTPGIGMSDEMMLYAGALTLMFGLGCISSPILGILLEE